MGMYLRRIARRRKDGSQVAYFQLARKVRDERGRVRDDIVYHFGRADQLAEDQLRRLVRSISRVLSPVEQTQLTAQLEGAGADLAVEHSAAFGGAYLLDALWRRLGIDTALREAFAGRAVAGEVERLIFAMVANRALAPRSKLAVERWVGRKAAIPGLAEASAHRLYRAMDELVAHGEAVQRAVFESTASLLNLEVDLLLVDTTSVYFEVEEADDTDGLRRFGHSKDHREDRPQIVIALAVTRGGLPVRCWTVPGNTADAAMVERVQRDLAGWRLNRVVWVMDRGMAGETQRAALQRGGGHAILGEKLRSGQADVEAALKRPGRFRKIADDLEAKEITLARGSQKRRFVLVRNPAEAERDRAQRAAILDALEAELQRQPAGAEGHGRRACGLFAHPVYGRYLRQDARGRPVIDKAKVAAEARLDGKYLLSTTDPSLAVADVVLGFKQLAEVERAFRTLKSHLELRPIHHYRPHRIEAHVLLCWLALLLVRVVETETGQTWRRVREAMEDMALVTLSGKDGRLQAVSQPTHEQRNILNTLNIPPPKPLRKAVTTPAAA